MNVPSRHWPAETKLLLAEQAKMNNALNKMILELNESSYRRTHTGVLTIVSLVQDFSDAGDVIVD